ncbi:MAG TPA: BTAD domain-containing putative transcriptional regulator, partial [Anaerolineales bacterium]|nr:BTAD domain-containing putative transcriptional regulator [Anaerolineales bacterium]
MPGRLVLRFLGLPQLHLDDKPISTDRRKAIALLAYLAVNDLDQTPQRYSREFLSGLLWPEVDQTKAFSNLRTIIWEVRQTLGEGWLLADRESIRLNREARIELDVERFRDLFLQAGKENDPALRIPPLSNAVKLYRDHFLTGFSLKDAPNFNDWAFAKSEELRRQFAEALAMLSDDHCTLGQADLAILHARRLVSLDPLNEASHRQLMEVYLQAGQKNAALKQYQECEQILRKELNLDPQPETRELYRKIRKGELTAGHKKERSSVSVPPATAAADIPSGTVTFLFTDIEGSTKLATQYPAAMPALLARQQEIINQAFQMHHGYVFQVVGDSMAAAFHSSGDALHAAVEAQRCLQNEDWAPVPIKVRMAIHTGTAHLQSASEPTRYSSYATLAMTQRIMATGYGGQVLVSQAAQELARSGLPEAIQFRDLGEYHLKDFAQTERIYQVVFPDLVNDFPPLRILDAHPNNLPVQLTTFIGRKKEQAEIRQPITEDRLVTLLGVGGIGKTRLSIEAAREVLGAFPGGVWFVELASLSDPERVSQTVFTTLGLIEQPGRPPVEILIDFLRSKKALLILDNCEHLIQSCAQVAQNLLSSCPDLHILATSREALGIPGETLYIVPTLSTPDPLHTTLETLSASEAAQLFIERAQTALAGFTLTEENAPAIAQLCHHLDGIPLAIELAAARVKLLRVEEIAARLDDRFRLLTGGARTALPRHQTLQALIDWSYDLLSEPERVLLRRLSVFAGGWTLEAAEQVVGNERAERGDIESIVYDLQPGDVLDLLTSLVNKSLILVEHKPEQGTRYDMLETIRQYARQKVWQADEEELLRQRHLEYYIDLAEQAEPNLRSFDMVMWLDRLESERDNIRSALEWAQESHIE